MVVSGKTVSDKKKVSKFFKDLEKDSREKYLNSLGLDELSKKYFDILKNENKVSNNTLMWSDGVIRPFDMKDPLSLSYVKSVFDFTADTSNILISNLALRSVEGKIQEGHGGFDEKYPNTSLDDVLEFENIEHINFMRSHLFRNDRELYNNENSYRLQSQQIIDKVGSSAFKMAKNPSGDFTFSSNKDLSIPFLNNVSKIPFLMGLTFSGMFDSKKFRKLVNEKYGINYRYGESYIVDTQKLASLNISFKELSSGEYRDSTLNNLDGDKRVELFEEIGVIVKEYSSVKNKLQDLLDSDSLDIGYKDYMNCLTEYKDILDKKHVQAYVSINSEGQGLSDDLACMNAQFIDFNTNKIGRGKKYYESLQRGSHAGDLVDTIGKYSHLYSSQGFDGLSAEISNREFIKTVSSKKNPDGYLKSLGLDPNKYYSNIKKSNGFTGLVDIDEVVDLMALSKNPYEKMFSNNKKDSQSEKVVNIHSSAVRFIKPIILTNGQKTTMIDQQLSYNDSALRAYGAYGGDGSVNVGIDPNSEVGFHKTPFHLVMNYHKEKLITPLVNPDKRERLIRELYNVK